MAGNKDKLVAVYDVFDILSAPNPPLYVMPASEAYRTWQLDVPFPTFTAAHLAAGPPPPPILHPPSSCLSHDNQKLQTLNESNANWQRNYRNHGKDYASKSPSWENNGTFVPPTALTAFKQGDFNISSKRSQNRRNMDNSSSSNDTVYFNRKKLVHHGEGIRIDNNEKTARRSSGDHKKNGIAIIAEHKSKNDHHNETMIVIGRYPADPSGGGSLVITKTKSRVMCRLEYSREFMLQCSLSPWTKLSPAQMPSIVHNFSELLPPGPQAFCLVTYKGKYNKLCQST